MDVQRDGSSLRAEPALSALRPAPARARARSDDAAAERPRVRPALRRRPPASLVIGAAVAGLSALFWPPFVTPDSMYALLWGRELLDGALSTYAPGPTPHPLTIALGALASLLGAQGGYVATFLLFGPVALGALAAAVFTVGHRLASPWAGGLAVALLLTSVPVLVWASVARYDIAFGALVMTALAIEMTHPRRGLPTLALLAVAGLVRPEAWLLAGLYWLWALPRMGRGEVTAGLLLVAGAPAIWMAMDAGVTGDALYSLHYTEDASEHLYGQFSKGENLAQGWQDLLACAGLMAIVVAPFSLARRRGLSPEALALVWILLALSLGVFLALVVRGMASNERYLLLPGCLIAVLAGVAASPARSNRLGPRVLVVLAGAALMLQCLTRSDQALGLHDRLDPAVKRVSDTRELVQQPYVERLLESCDEVAISTKLMHGWSWFSARPPARWTLDERGESRPDVYVAPATAAAARDLLTRRRFDEDASFKVPKGLRAGARRGDWRVYVRPRAGCVVAARRAS